ncbi:pyridoxamine 5'-phosphate oxidase family protein [Brevibacterium sp. CFH 10365]|uniref:pyridoxamine 5'-phosphate oxidase family protein n=1 Tax=Brevibacterium sp. CFH 10365 TaxID=2585207 RepID=UPI001D0D61E0|nr:pyridoxamine 5'-phosphate oxidase family protein [Brevibacterium sp. CFH 10365]
MNNRDKSDESPAEEKARDVAAKLDETAEPLAGTSDMESHAEVGYTEQNVEARAQNAAEEEGVTLHRNPDGSHTAIDESKAAEVTPSSGSKDSGVASSTAPGGAPSSTAPGAGAAVGSTAGASDDSRRNSKPSVAPGMGASVGTTSDPDDVDSVPGMGNAVGSTAEGGAASTAAAASATGSTSAGDASANATDDTEAGQVSAAGDGQKPAGEAATDQLDQADVVKILRGGDSVMLATALADGKILAHPMAPQEVTEDADVWFFLALDGDQAKALRTNPEVNISIAEAGNWLSVAGRVEFVDDEAKVDDLWSDSDKAWFDDRRDPNLGLIKVITHSAQHWGLPGGKASGLFRMVKSKITGDRPAGGTQTTEL